MLTTLVPRRITHPVRRLAPFAFARELDRMLDDVWRGFGTPAAGVAPESFSPRVDIRETEGEILIAAELPGLDEKDLVVSLEEGVLTVKGERKHESEDGDEEKGRRHVESVRGRFHRAFRLPEEVDAASVKAAYKNGILSVTLPKLPQEKPEVRHIPINAG